MASKYVFWGEDSFVSLTELERLEIVHCLLSTIDLGAFNGLTQLTRLIITANYVSEIIPGTFENMINLEYLQLVDNKIKHVDRDMFSGLFTLKYIYLSKNQLQYLHPDAFVRLQNLKMLYLNNNPDIQIPTERNFIKSLSLPHLDISRCNVSSLSVETFPKVSALGMLDLRYNKLKTVDINISKALLKLSSLYLYGNPLQCDCQLQEV